MLPVDDMRWCRWCQQTKSVEHYCAGDPDAPPCPTEAGQPCGVCTACIADQCADLGVTRTTDGDHP